MPTPLATGAGRPALAAQTGVAGRLLTTVLFGVRPLDPVTFASVTIVLALTAAMSMAGPAWRAARIDPAIALRSQ